MQEIIIYPAELHTVRSMIKTIMVSIQTSKNM